MRRTLQLGCALAALVPLVGCAGEPRDDARFDVPAGAYGAAFDAARDALRDAGYTLERVDAGAGVITTRPRTEPALDAPAGGADSALNAQRSMARVSFAPSTGAHATDLRAHEGALEARVEILVERLQRPGRRIESMTIRRSSSWRDPAWESRGMQPAHVVATGLDEHAAGRLAARIAADRRLIIGADPR